MKMKNFEQWMEKFHLHLDHCQIKTGNPTALAELPLHLSGPVESFLCSLSQSGAVRATQPSTLLPPDPLLSLLNSVISELIINTQPLAEQVYSAVAMLTSQDNLLKHLYNPKTPLATDHSSPEASTEKTTEDRQQTHLPSACCVNPCLGSPSLNPKDLSLLGHIAGTPASAYFNRFYGSFYRFVQVWFNNRRARLKKWLKENLPSQSDLDSQQSAEDKKKRGESASCK